MTALPKALAAALALAALASAAPPNYDSLAQHSGTVRHSPLRVEVSPKLGWDGIVPRQAMSPGLRALLGTSSYADQELTFRTDERTRLLAVEGHTRADATILGSLGLGGAQVGTVRTNEPLSVLSQRTITSPTGAKQSYYEVFVGGVRGWVPAGQVAIGETNAIAGAIGDMLAPAFAKGTETREARFFHPDGEVFRAKVESLAPTRFRTTADGLAGEALIRLGNGFWKVDKDGNEPDRLDALGMAIRFYDPAAGGPSPSPRAGDFDLLLTSWSERFNQLFWRTPFQTNVHDFFDNEYFPAIPFKLEGEEVWVRVVPEKVDPQGPNRIGRLLAAVEAGKAVFYLEVQGEPEQERTWYGGTRDKPRVWTRLAKIQLQAHMPEFDQDALRYHPGMGGRGFEPTGWVTRIRRPVYRGSQDAREGLIDGVKTE